MFFRISGPLLALLCAGGVASAAPRVVVSIGPVHSLVAGVMQGVGTPDLLVEGGGSPHDQAMRPSRARALQDAALIVWVGPTLEQFLDKPIRSLGRDARLITLMEMPGITLLTTRDGLYASGRKNTVNPHIWLSPDNAIAIAAIVADALGELDAANAAVYRRNAAATARRIDTLAAEIEFRLGAVKARPYMVLHDAYRYFDQRFGMNVVGAIMATPEQKPGARRLLEIRRRIVSQHVVCVFGEPRESTALLESVAAGTATRIGMLDPLVVNLPAGPDAYFGMMRGIATALVDCLAS